MREALENAKSRGINRVSVDDVLKHVSDLNNAISSKSKLTEVSLEFEKYSWEKRLDEHRAYLSAVNDSRIKMFDSVISSGQNAIRILLTINGGAAIAVLAFLGHLASINSSMLPAFSLPLKWFTCGVASVGAAAAGTYLTQLAFSSERKLWRRVGVVLQFVTILCGLASIILFVFGLREMGALFRNF